MWTYFEQFSVGQRKYSLSNSGSKAEESEMSWNLDYCPEDLNLNHIWVKNGFSHCFVETLVDCVSLSFTIIFGVTQLWFYRKYATQVKHYVLPYSQLFGLQIVLNVLMPVLTLVHFFLDMFTPEEGEGFYGYMILSLIQGFVVWPMITYLILQERNNMLPTVPRKGHGLILLTLWTWIFAAQNFLLLNIESPIWFFALNSGSDIFRFLLFLLEYGMTGLILVLGIKAPGIPSFQDSDSFMRLISNEYISYSALGKNQETKGGTASGTDSGGGGGRTTDSTSAEEESLVAVVAEKDTTTATPPSAHKQRR